jgi:hypothetical protein
MVAHHLGRLKLCLAWEKVPGLRESDVRISVSRNLGAERDPHEGSIPFTRIDQRSAAKEAKTVGGQKHNDVSRQNT